MMDDTWQGKVHPHFLSLYFHQGNSYSLRRDTKGRFSFFVPIAERQGYKLKGTRWK